MRRLFLLLPFALAACSNPIDETSNVLVPDKAEGPCGEMLVEGDWYVFTSLRLESLGEGGPALLGSLNGLWQKDIEGKELTLALKVVKASSTEVELQLVSGARVGSDGVCLQVSTLVNVVAPITESGIGPTGQTNLVVYSGSQESPKNCAPESYGIHGIPVTNVVISAACDASTGLLQGKIDGALRREDIYNICTCLDLTGRPSDEACGVLDTSGEKTDDQPCGACIGQKADGKTVQFQHLGLLVPGLNGGTDLTYACQDADGKESACLVASFDARKLDQAPPECP